MSIDPNLIVRAGTIAPPSQDSAVRIIGRGLDTAPILRQGLGVTWMFAAVAAAGRVVVPILIQQAIDKGIVEETGGVQVDLVVKIALIGAVVIIGRVSASVRPRSGSVCAASERCTTCGSASSATSTS